jgi:uncharacterized membrane protein
MESLLYSIAGLPVHPLIVHFAVVILPLATTALIALIYMPKLKHQYSFITTIAIVLGSAAVLVAKQTGEALAERMGTPVEHADYASLLTGAAFIFMVLTLIWYRSSKGRRSRVVTPLGHTTVLAGIAVLGLTFLTGHTGAQAVWKGRMTDTASVTSSPSPSATAKATKKAVATYKYAEVKKHANSTSCWSIINGNVYDLTKWINRHPGGASVIKNICGRDGSKSFSGQHGGQNRPASTLTAYKIGIYK